MHNRATSLHFLISILMIPVLSWGAIATSSYATSNQGVVPATITSPTPGSTLTSPTVTVEWLETTQADKYFLALGTYPEILSGPPWADVYLYQGTETAVTVPSIPLTGERIFARLWSQIDGRLYYEDLFFETATPTPSALLFPADGTTLNSPNIMFQWAEVEEATEYLLGIGSSAEAVSQEPFGDIYMYKGVETSVNVSVIPQDGSQVYVRLWTNFQGLWVYEDHEFTSAQAEPATLLTPVPGSTLDSLTVRFSWTPKIEATEYMLGVGSSQEAVSDDPWGDIYLYAGTDTSIDVVLPSLDGSPAYVRLWSKINTRWYYEDYMYATVTLGPPTLTQPDDGSIIDSHFVNFQWPNADAQAYALGVGTSVEAIADSPWGDIYFGQVGTELSKLVADLPLDGNPIHVRLWSTFDDVMLFTDHAFDTIVSTDPPNFEEECIAKGWQKVSIEEPTATRQVFWKAPPGPWTRGVIIALHGGGGHYGHWCALSGTGNAYSVEAMNDFSEASISEGFAVFAVDATLDLVTDSTGRTCGKRFDFMVNERPNLDLPFIDRLLTDIIPGLRPTGSATEVFVTGLSTGGYMAIRIGTRFDDMVSAVAPVAAGDPYGTTLWCDEDLSDRELAPGVILDNETQLAAANPDACVSVAYPNEQPWDTTNPSQKPPFKLHYHIDDPIIDQSCFDKAQALLLQNGYSQVAPHVATEQLDPEERQHYWQANYNESIIEFFKSVYP